MPRRIRLREGQKRCEKEGKHRSFKVEQDTLNVLQNAGSTDSSVKEMILREKTDIAPISGEFKSRASADTKLEVLVGACQALPDNKGEVAEVDDLISSISAIKWGSLAEEDLVRSKSSASLNTKFEMNSCEGKSIVCDNHDKVDDNIFPLECSVEENTVSEKFIVSSFAPEVSEAKDELKLSAVPAYGRRDTDAVESTTTGGNCQVSSHLGICLDNLKDACQKPSRKQGSCESVNMATAVQNGNKFFQEAVVDVPVVFVVENGSGGNVDKTVSFTSQNKDAHPSYCTNIGHSTSNPGSDVLVDSSVKDTSVLPPQAEEISGSQSANTPDKRETGESIERCRQRLWCFYFENLDRTIDELYLLCELECDVEQMNEAILVLEEATFDFKELRSRVEAFEKTRKIPPQSSTIGTTGTMKVGHRRPHAISWEVRRTTMSSRRAEILSSSLEAFKKIQTERSSKSIACHSKGKSSLNTPQVEDLDKRSRKKCFLPGQGKSTDKQQNIDMKKRPSLPRTHNYPADILLSCSNSSQVAQDCSTAFDLSAMRENYTSFEVAREKETNQIPSNNLDRGHHKSSYYVKGTPLVDRYKDKKASVPWKYTDAWKVKRNWDDILMSSIQSSSRGCYPATGRHSERARGLHDKLMSPENKKKSVLDLKKESEDKQARATRIRLELENERVQRLQRTSEKLNRVNKWQAVRSSKLREGMYARHQRSEFRHEAYLAQVARRAGDESSKVNEVRFITSLNEENKKLILRQKLHDSEVRRTEKLQSIKTKQKEDSAREEAAFERRKLLEAEKLQRLAETQRRKEEAHIRREEERRASSAAREARALEHLRRKEVRARAQREEAELLAQKLIEKLKENELRRKFYLEQVREKASMDYRDQSLACPRRLMNEEDSQIKCIAGQGTTEASHTFEIQQHLHRKKIKKIRQRLMALKYVLHESSDGFESSQCFSRSLISAAKLKICSWIQELQRLRQARKEGAVGIKLIVGDMIKFLEGKELELHASQQAGLLDFVASALPASHTSKPDSCQVTFSLLQLLKVLLSLPANRSYYIAQNLLPPVVPMLSAALENYIKIAASQNFAGSTVLTNNRTISADLDSLSSVLEGFLHVVTSILGHVCIDERQLKMWGGLMELLVSYNVIHHMRDFFSLYDRPQVEGSPFAPPILLGLELLNVLTYRSGLISLTDFRPTLSKDIEHSLQVAKDAEVTGINTQDSSSTLGLLHGAAGLQWPVHTEGLQAISSCDAAGSRKVGAHPSRKSEARKPDENGDERDNSHASQCTSSDNGFSTDNVEASPRTLNLLMDVVPYTKNVDNKIGSLKQPVLLLVSAIAETGLVSLPSLLTAVLLQANNSLSSDEASNLPANFDGVATEVLKVLNNLAFLDLELLQSVLARSDLQMEFFHLMSFLLSYCTSKWKTSTDQVGSLLVQTLSLIGYFALQHPGNQEVLHRGKSPTILHKVCDLPFVFFSDPELIPVLVSTLMSSCYGCEQNKGIVQQELSTDMLLSLLNSCKNTSSTSNPVLLEIPAPESKKTASDVTQRTTRQSQKASRNRGSMSGSSSKPGKLKQPGFPKDATGSKPAQASPSIMFYSRVPNSFWLKAEEFFCSSPLELNSAS